MMDTWIVLSANKLELMNYLWEVGYYDISTFVKSIK
jgi:hypothetical protein